MGLLDQVIGSVVGQVLGGGREQPTGHGGGYGGGYGQGGGAGSALSPIVTAILMSLIAKGVSGGLGSILGGGAPQSAPQGGGHGSGRGDGDLGGFGQAGGHDGSLGGNLGGSLGGERGGGGQYADLSGMLDGPGDRNSGSAGAGPYAQLDREPGQPGGGGLDDLIGSFQQNGLGDVIGSWIGGGQNKDVAPGRLEDVLGRNTIDGISRQTGIGRDELLSTLAQMLPQVIDALTPQGRVPSPEERRGW